MCLLLLFTNWVGAKWNSLSIDFSITAWHAPESMDCAHRTLLHNGTKMQFARLTLYSSSQILVLVAEKKRVELGWAFFQLFLKCSESFELSLQNQFQVCRRLQERSVDPKIHLWFGFRVFRPCFCLRMPFQENKYHKLSCYAMYKWTRCLTVEDMGGFVSALTSLLLCQSSCQSFLVVSRDYRQDTPGCCLSIWRETAWIYSPILPKWVSLSTVCFVSNLSGHYFIYTHQNQPTANDIMTASSSHTQYSIAQ